MNGNESQPAGPVRVFVSYASEDRELKKIFDKNLEVMRGQNLIYPWTDGELVAGETWRDSISDAMMSAEVVIFLVSTDFLASSFIREYEVPPTMARVDRGEAVLVPVILRKTPGWEKAVWYRQQALPSMVKPVVEWRSPQEGFAEVDEGLRKLFPKLPGLLAAQRIRWEAEQARQKKLGGVGGTDVGGTGVGGTGVGGTGVGGATEDRNRWRSAPLIGTVAAVLFLLALGLFRNFLPSHSESHPDGQPATPVASTPVASTPVASTPAPSTPAPFVNSIDVIYWTGARVEDTAVPARRVYGTTVWVDENGRHEAQNGIVFDFGLRAIREAQDGPFLVSYYVKSNDTRQPGTMKIDPEVHLVPVKDSYWKERGFTLTSDWALASPVTAAVAAPGAPATGGFSPLIVIGENGHLPAGDHELGLEVKRGSALLYRGVAKLNVFESDPQDEEVDLDLPPFDADQQNGTPYTGQVIETERVDKYPFTSEPNGLAYNGVSLKVKVKPHEGKPLAGPAEYRLYVKAALPGETAANPHEIVAEPGASMRETSGFNRNYQARFLDLGSTLTRGQSPASYPAFFVGEHGKIPAGEHTIGLSVVSNDKVVFRRLVKIRVP